MTGRRGFIAACVRNPVFVNLLMVCMLVAGLIGTRRMVREAYPAFYLDHVLVEVVWPGAAAEDVERSVCVPIEEAIEGIAGTHEISSSAQENHGTVYLALRTDVKDPKRVLQEVKDRVGQVTILPTDAEEPITTELIFRTPVIDVAVYGDVSERVLKQFAQDVRDDLLASPEISEIAITGIREDEIAIEITREALQAYNLTLNQVMQAVSQGSLDMPAGVIRTRDEELTLRVAGRRMTAADYEDLVVIERSDALVRLRDVATVRDAFEDVTVQGRFAGEPAMMVSVYKTPQQDTTRIAALVRDYVEKNRATWPETVQMEVWADGSTEITSRIEMLVKNGLMGVVLVLITLTLFLDLRSAIWVAVGIPVAFSGALATLYGLGETVNMLSLFSLLMVSGIIVDDAIVIAESIHTQRGEGLPPLEASIEGTRRMFLPVAGASVTTILAFIPLLFVLGVMGRFIHVVPVVVIAAIVASGLEAFCILPSHLAGHRRRRATARDEGREADATKGPGRFRRGVESLVQATITRGYRPIYRWCLRNRGIVLGGSAAGVLLVAGLVRGGHTPFVLLPREDSTILKARVRFAEGTPASVTQQTIERIEAAAYALNEDADVKPTQPGALVQHVYAMLGEFGGIPPERGNQLCEVRIELMPLSERGVPASRVMDRWREEIGEIPLATHFTIVRETVADVGEPIELRLLGDDLETLKSASLAVQNRLRSYEGVTNAHDDLLPGKRELRVKLIPAARALNLTLADVARQLRHGFFGGEAVRLQRGKEEVKVRVRYPEEDRQSILDLERALIRTRTGAEVPFREVAEVQWTRGWSQIQRQDGHRRIRVYADVDEHTANAEEVVRDLEANFLPGLLDEYPGTRYVPGGNRERANRSLRSLLDGYLIAMVGMYAVLAGLLRSYVQPIVIILSVPVGLVGGVIGHAVMGYDLTMMSVFGLVALSGVVVNDALVLIDYINRRLREGVHVKEAVYEAGEARFRAVVLTTLTTVVGLGPLLLEQSGQALTVLPMAISLVFGLTFATALTLIVVPALFLTVNDVRRVGHWLRFGGGYPAAEDVEEGAAEASEMT
jgi:multidrug efflux pump subunit AcrB